MCEPPERDEETLEAKRQEVLAAVGATLLLVQSAEKVVQGRDMELPRLKILSGRPWKKLRKRWDIF